MKKNTSHTKIVCLDFFFFFGMGALSNMVLFFYFLAKVISLDSQQFFFVVVSCNWPFYVQHDDYSVILEIVGFFFPDVVLNRMENISRVLK